MTASKTETGAQLLARLGSRPSITEVLPDLFVTGPEGKEIYEIVGTEGTGKTEFLLNVVASIILPKSWRNIQLHGSDASVIFIDTDYKFSIIRLAMIMEKKIIEKIETCSKNTIPPSEDDMETFITDCLKKLSLVHCNSSSHLLITLYSLETFISNNPNISVLMIDSISAFYWLDKATGGESTSMQELRLRQISDYLSKLVNDYNLVLFATRAILFQKKLKDYDSKGGNSDQDMESMEYLCKSWQRKIDYKLIMTKDYESNCHVACEGLNISRDFIIDDSGIKFLPQNILKR